jgi:hypothetical protein
VRGIGWVSIKNWLKLMPWSNFEYLNLGLTNGSEVVITSLMMIPTDLHALLAKFEIIHNKKVIPTIR